MVRLCIYDVRRGSEACGGIVLYVLVASHWLSDATRLRHAVRMYDPPLILATCSAAASRSTFLGIFVIKKKEEIQDF